jgi:hypothetical protein
MSEPITFEDEKRMWMYWANMVAADSLMSEVAYRYGTHLPQLLRADLIQHAHDCREEAKRLKADIEERRVQPRACEYCGRAEDHPEGARPLDADGLCSGCLDLLRREEEK